MKKFNEFESYLIEEALTQLIKDKEEAVLKAEKESKGRCIFASGYFTMIGKELIDKVVNDMTRKPRKS
jgi:hypothetical protein|tara:strand:- start:529 stop:732 length:204 start_codon:yes stop_codon:yes gene_type:complete